MKVLYLIVMTAGLFLNRDTKAQFPGAGINSPVITFERDTVNYGTIAHNSNGTRILKFTNMGMWPLVIQDIHGSGPNYASYQKEPIQPGVTTELKVYYCTERVGRFMKTLTIVSNAIPSPKIIYIIGNVLPDTAIKTQQTGKDPNAPVITFEKDTVDYGTIPHNSNNSRLFKFTNTGKEPLIIESALGNGPPTVSWPHEPIQPGASSVINVHYPTDRIGRFFMPITIRSNATQSTKQIWFMGTVLPDQAIDKNAPVITFEKDTLDYGTLTYSKEYKIDSITFTNTGKEPLLISAIYCSGESVMPGKWPNYPILPGQSGKIKLFLLRDFIGRAFKGLNIVSNASPKPKVLFFKWKVVPDTTGISK